MDKKRTGVIYGVNGPVIYLQGKSDFKMSEMVYVGEQRLVGEVIALDKERTTIQVYEETSGLRPGEIVEASGAPVSVTLAPGILDNIFDGIERPLERIADKGGAFITRGVSVDSLDREKKWKTHLTVKKGDVVHGGSVIAEVPETRAIVHKCMVPPEVEVAKVVDVVPDGDYTIDISSLGHRSFLLHIGFLSAKSCNRSGIRHICLISRNCPVTVITFCIPRYIFPYIFLLNLHVLPPYHYILRYNMYRQVIPEAKGEDPYKKIRSFHQIFFPDLRLFHCLFIFC